ncbi:MAG TPA: glycosyl hydrolase family 18 protein [Polyangiaceae bacterium]|nr:glycosyl hydrolase family 18 protein [Polyangiaceae bacterium]
MDRRRFGLCAGSLLALSSVGCVGQLEPRRSNIKRVKWKGSGKRVVGYFTNWAQYRKRDCKFEVRHIDANLFTHIIFGFAKIDPHDRANPKFELVPFEHNDLGPGGQYQQLNDLKRKYPHLKTLLAVGGWSFNDPPTAWIFTTMAESKENRAHFIQHAVQYLRNNNFDGLDLDWEYPTDETRGGRPQDRENFTALVAEFKEAARAEAAKSGKEELLLTMAAGAHKADTLELEKIAEHLDWVNLMAYDFYGGWAQETGMNAPLSGDPTGDFYVAKAVDNWLKGIPPEKLVLGMPTYGRSFGGVEDPRPASKTSGAGPKGRCTGEVGFLSYYEINDLIESGQYKTYWDDVSNTPYAYDVSSKSWVTYDDLRSISMKVDFIEQKGLGGGMFWAIDLDDFQNDYPIITSVARRLRGG